MSIVDVNLSLAGALGEDRADLPASRFDAWADARDQMHAAYATWSRARRPDRADAYCAFVAACDREAAAADAYLRAPRRG